MKFGRTSLILLNLPAENYNVLHGLSYIKCKILSVLLFSVVFFVLSCRSDSINGINNLNGHELKQKSFRLNQLSSKTVQGINHTGLSPRLYAGILDNGDTVSTLINIRSDILNSHQICESDSIGDFKLILNTLTTLTSDDATEHYISKDLLIIIPYIDESPIEETEILSNINITSLISHYNGNELDGSFIELSKNKIEIDLMNYDNSLFNHICIDEKNIGLKISYLPDEENIEKFIEILSSDIMTTNANPTLNIEYFMDEEDSVMINRYSIDQIYWGNSLSGENSMNNPIFIDDSSMSQWGMVYLFDINSDSNDEPPNYNELQINTNIITDNLNSELEVVEIKTILNSSIEMESISFSLGNVIAFSGKTDPNEDNEPDGTELNESYDLGELYDDFGIDNCPDSLETGDENNLCSLSISIYNPSCLFDKFIS